MLTMRISSIILSIIFVVGCSKASNNKDNIIVAMNYDKECCSDSVRVQKMIDSNIYYEQSSNIVDYAMLFNYLLNHQNEEYDEAIGTRLFQMLSTFPSKFKQIERYMKDLSSSDQDLILERITILVGTELFLQNEDENETINLFYSKFPFLCKYKVCTTTFQTLINDI